MLIKDLLHPIKLLLLSVLLLAAPLCLKAQQGFTLKGIVVTAKTNERQAKVEITNLNTQVVRSSDDQGMFTIPAHAGDTLSFDKASFTVFKQVVESTNDIVIYLQPAIILNTVTVKGQSTKQSQQEALDAYRSKGIYYNGKPPVLSAIGSPINALYEAFSKDAKQARRFNKYIKEENESIQINQRYNKALIKRITNLSDEEIPIFMDAYRPSIEDIRKWNDYDLINYIKKSLNSYNGLREKPLPALPAKKSDS